MTARRIGLFGGSFDPPHIAHLVVAEAARDQGRLDRVIWMPAATSPFKPDGAAADAHHRLAMTRLATAGHAAFEVSDLEVRRGGTSYTIDTLEALNEAYPASALHLVLGGDALRGLPDWRRARAILALASVLVYRRPGDALDDFELPAWLAPHVQVVEAPLIDLSATELRAHLAAGRSGRFLVPDAVLEYVARHRLYQPGS